MIKRAIVIDFEPEVFRGNKILDPSWAANFPGATLFSDLAALARAQGFEVMTSDVYLSQGSVAPRASVLTDAKTRYTKSLARRARMAVLFSGESPGIIPWFYYRLSEYSRAYKHALLFRGFRGGVDRRVAFHPFYWPFSRGEMRSGPSFGDRRLLVMVASHKRRYPMVPGRRLRSAAGNALRLGRWWYYQATDPTLRFTDHYETRVRAVAHFAPRPDFQLHGAGWEGAKTSLPGRPIRFAAPPTRCADKMATTSGFRFSLAFENCSYPGYVTEKIFESFLAGCVPVYCGAPDIADFCGRECFLDLADFASFEELERALRGFSEAEWNRKREAIRDFLASDLFRRHDQEALVQDLFTWLAE